jgi:hypothetical protein
MFVTNFPFLAEKDFSPNSEFKMKYWDRERNSAVGLVDTVPFSVPFIAPI